MNRTLAEIEADIAQVNEALTQVRGTETEVYARIVGYYRSVRNWNKGKRDEYNHRKQFVITAENTHTEQALFTDCATDCSGTHAAVSDTETAGVHTENNAIENAAFYEFFGKHTCPNCPPVKNYLTAVEIEGAYIDVDTPSGLQQAAARGVLSAPTVIVFDKNGNELARAHSVAELAAVFIPTKQHVA